jgi:hypothetical protein
MRKEKAAPGNQGQTSEITLLASLEPTAASGWFGDEASR